MSEQRSETVEPQLMTPAAILCWLNCFAHKVEFRDLGNARNRNRVLLYYSAPGSVQTKIVGASTIGQAVHRAAILASSIEKQEVNV